jgi:hypothetical protein
VTPFDPTALLVMLLTFYPIVSGGELLRARRERPDYFAGGEIIGRHFDALRLPDGVVWDLIFAVDGPGVPRWQAIQPGGGDGGGGDPAFALVAGPLDPIDVAAWPTRTREDVFLPLVADAIAALGGSDAVLDRALLEGAGVLSDDTFGAVVNAELGGSDGILAGSHWILDGADPSDEISATIGLDPRIDANDADYDEPPPPDMPDVPDPGGTPPPDVDIPSTVSTAGAPAAPASGDAVKTL